MDEHIEKMLRLKKNLALRALESFDLKSAWNHLTQALATLSTNLTTPADDRAYASASLELADLSFAMGKGFDELIIILQTALPASEQLGNRRFHAMINLHLARLYYFGGEQPKAIDAFIKGKKEVEELGDEDILVYRQGRPDIESRLQPEPGGCAGTSVSYQPVADYKNPQRKPAPHGQVC